MLKLRGKSLAVLGVLTAMEIMLSRFFSISAWDIKIGFNFLPVVVAGSLFGALPAALVAAMGDFVGALLFPIGPYFPGFTLTAFLKGLVWGVFLHGEEKPWKIACAVGINQWILGLLLNSTWISLLYGAPWSSLLAARFIQAALLSGVQFVVVTLLAPRMRSWKGALK